MAELDGVQVRQQLIVQQRQPVADTQIVFKESHAHLRIGGVPSDGEFGAAGFLPMKKTADRFDGLELVIEVGLEVEFHGGSLK